MCMTDTVHTLILEMTKELSNNTIFTKQESLKWQGNILTNGHVLEPIEFKSVHNCVQEL